MYIILNWNNITMNNLCIHPKLFLMVITCCDIPKICCKILTADAVFSSKCEELTSETKVYRKAKITEKTVYNPISNCRHGTFSKEHGTFTYKAYQMMWHQ